jgi:hypothetical protein
MMRPRSCLAALAALMVTVWSQAARAQVPGASLRDGEFEVGLAYHDFERELAYDDKPSTLVNGVWSALLRMGVTESFTASVELSGGLGGVDVGNYTYAVGAAVQSCLWAHASTRATTSIGYTRLLSVYREEAGASLKVQSLDWNALLEQDARWKSQSLTFWAGPTISYVSAEPQAPAAENYSESTQLLGVIAGTRVVFARHVSITAQGNWINNFEPSVALAYRF